MEYEITIKPTRMVGGGLVIKVGDSQDAALLKHIIEKHDSAFYSVSILPAAVQSGVVFDYVALNNNENLYRIKKDHNNPGILPGTGSKIETIKAVRAAFNIRAALNSSLSEAKRLVDNESVIGALTHAQAQALNKKIEPHGYYLVACY